MREKLRAFTPDVPLVSIITVVLNGETYLEDAICSVLDQSYGNIEYIIIDGGSTDSTLDIIRKYEGRIDYWISEPDNGLYDAMNKGIDLAKGEFIGILSSDDYYLNNTVQLIMDAAIDQPQKDVFHGNLKLIRKNGYEQIRLPRIRKEGYRPYLMPVNHPTVFIRSVCYAECGTFNTTYRTAADFDLMLRFLIECKLEFHYLDRTLTCMREGGASGRYSLQSYEDIKDILGKRNLPWGEVFRFRVWYRWLLFMQYSKRFWIVRSLMPLYYKRRRSGN